VRTSCDTSETGDRKSAVSLAIILSILVSILLGVIELILSSKTGNRALFMDGIVNILCIIPGSFSLMSLRISYRMADWKMQYGYRRVETVMILFFALLVCGVATEQIAELFLSPIIMTKDAGVLTMVYATGAILAEFILSQYLWRTGRKYASQLLLLDAVLIRGDMIISAIILAGGLFLTFYPEMTLIQMILTLIVLLIIFAYGLREAVSSIRELIDAAPSLQVNVVIERLVEENPEVFFISQQRIRTFGGALAVDLTIEVDPCLTVLEAYRLSSGLEKKISSEVENVMEVTIRTHPAGAYAGLVDNCHIEQDV
jgi:cation diffusion facilitator family transporter